MRTGKYELVIVWDNARIKVFSGKEIYEYPAKEEKEIYEYPTREEAETAERGMRTAFGNQIVWSCVREQLIKGERV